MATPRGFLYLSLIVVLSSQLVQAQDITECNYNSETCSCQTNKGEISLKGLSEEKEMWEMAAGDITYFWNPCKRFTQVGVTANAIQKISEDTGYDCGVVENANSDVEDGYARFYMMAEDFQRASYVKCECADSTTVTFDKEDPQTEYHFTLKSKYCCPGSSPGPHSEVSVSISIGSILVIVFFVLLVGYVVGSIAFNYGVRKQRGAELIPNRGFWAAIPGLVKDGVLFTFTCGKRRPEGYTKI